jgi:hypothetical protein
METQQRDPSPDQRDEIEALRETSVRLERAGLVVDRTSLSRAHRLAFFALQCHLVDDRARPEPTRPPIGFAYPDGR